MVQEKIEFHAADEISLIPIYCRAEESKTQRAIIDDNRAVEILEQIKYDYSEINVPKQAYFTLCMRAKKIDNYVREFLQENPAGEIIQLGCGMSTRASRISNYNKWYDIDYPGVIKFRKNFYETNESYQMLKTEILDYNWLDRLDKEKKYLFIAEGLLMYIKKDDIRAMLLELQERFTDSRLLFDCYNQSTVKRINKHHARTGMGSEIFWGLDDATEIERWEEGIELRDEWYFTDSEEIEKLFITYRVLFKLAGMLSSVREAHRILYYQL